MKKIFKLALHPKPQPEGFDTGLRFTDVLFGFVIKELFTRLLNWADLEIAVRLHLIVGTILVLGSWIGFRRSLYRSGYQLKFFNLPLFRFLVDQLMLILYFRIAVLTPVPDLTRPHISLDPRFLAVSTTKLVTLVFFLYVVWDLLGVWIAAASTNDNRPLYPKLDGDSKMTDQWQEVNTKGTLVSVISFALLLVLWLFSDCFSANALFFIDAAVLLAYRWAKEIRTSWQLPQ
jgi:hypothetical protein